MICVLHDVHSLRKGLLVIRGDRQMSFGRLDLRHEARSRFEAGEGCTCPANLLPTSFALGIGVWR